MRNDEGVLREKVAQLLGEPRPHPRDQHSRRSYSSTPIGFALTAFGVACDLAAAANYAESLANWEERQAQLRSWQDVLNADPIDDTCREALRSAVESLRMQGRTRCEETIRLSEWLAAAHRRVQALVDCCRAQQAEIREITETRLALIPADDVAAQQRVVAAARADALASCKVACKKIEIETQRVLLRNKRTADMSVRELNGMAAQRN